MVYTNPIVFFEFDLNANRNGGFFDGSSNWGFTYTSYDSFRYIFDVNQLHTFYHVFVNPSPLKGSDLQRHNKRSVVGLHHLFPIHRV